MDQSVLQVVMVVVPAWEATEGRLARFERSPDGGWLAVGPSHAVAIGHGGCGWGSGTHPIPAGSAGPRKREGDGRSPAGVFTIGTAFGAPPHVATGLAYQALDAGHWCVDVPGSPYYNRIVHVDDVGREAVAGSAEPMRRDLHLAGDRAYAVGFVIGHNPGYERDAGSCIFAHVWNGPGTTTAGCTAMAESDLLRLLAWLRREARPRFVLLPESERARLAVAWGLPPWPPEDAR